MKVRSVGTLVFCLAVGIPSCLFLGYSGWTSNVIEDLFLALLGLVVFVRCAQDAVSQKTYEADLRLLKREKVVRYAVYGRWAKFVPYVPAVLLLLFTMAPLSYPDQPQMAYGMLAGALVTSLIHLAVFLYCSHKMDLKDD